MKRSLCCICAVMLLCVLLCGCGSMRMNGHDVVTESPAMPSDILPEMSPIISPDVDNGTTGDTDGIIERSDNPGAEPGASPSPSGDPQR